jgi:S1-C subfamily serine protease
MIEYSPDPVYDALYTLLREECQTSEQFERYCASVKLKEPAVRKLGLVSKQDMLMLLHSKSPGGIRMDNRLVRAYDALVAADVLIQIGLGSNQLYDFQINFLMVLIYERFGCLDNIIKGPVFIMWKYARSAVAIVVKKDRQEFAATGSLLAVGVDSFVLTNRHVVDPGVGCSVEGVFLGGDVRAQVKHGSSFRLSATDDLALVPVTVPEEVPRFRLSPAISVLDKVIVLAYPTIPLTNTFQLTAHSGEINAQIQTRDGTELFLISSYAAPGSSGGPVLDYRGLIAGVVTERLEAEYDGGRFFHTAAVPLNRLLSFLGSRL